jgi:hypothetical protein
MKLEILVDGSLEILYSIDGSMEIMHVFFFSSFVENSGCYDNKWTENVTNLTHKLDLVIMQQLLKIVL